MFFQNGFENYTKIIEFEADNKKFADVIENDKYTLTNAVTQYKYVAVQIVLKDIENNTVFKSEIFEMRFKNSINAVETIEEEKPDVITVLVNEVVAEKFKTIEQEQKAQDDKIQDLEDNKVSKVDGKDLSTNDFTNEYKKKLDDLSNYDDTEIKEEISDIQKKNIEQDTLIEKLQAENKDLLRQIPTATVEGESIHIEDSSDLPFEEFSIEGNSKQETREGYNVLPITLESKTINGIEVTINSDGSIILNGTATSNFSLILFNGEIILEGNYVFYLIGKDSSLNLQGIEDSNTVAYLNYSTQAESRLKNYEVETILTRIFTYIQKDTSFTNKTFKVMITKGTEEKPYEPYGVMPSPDFSSEVKTVKDNVKLVLANKNLVNYENSSTVWNNANINTNGNTITYTPNADGKAGINHNSKHQKINLKAGTTIVWSQEYISGNKWEKGSLTNRLKLVDKNGDEINVFFGDITLNNYTDKKSIKTTLDRDIVEIYSNCLMYGIAGMTTPLVYRYQLEIDETATSFEEHQSQEITIPVQQEMLEGDTFVKEEGVWYEKHNWGKLVLDGNEGWYLQNNNNYQVTFAGTNRIYLKKSGIGISNYFKVNSSNIEVSLYPILQSNVDYIRIQNAINKWATLSDFKTYLAEQYNAGTPVMIYYPLATPLLLPCTAEQIQALEQLKELHTYKNITNIYSTDEISPIMYAKYRKDLATIQKQQDDRITAIEELLSTTATSAMLLDNVQSDLESEV